MGFYEDWYRSRALIDIDNPEIAKAFLEMYRSRNSNDENDELVEEMFDEGRFWWEGSSGEFVLAVEEWSRVVVDLNGDYLAGNVEDARAVPEHLGNLRDFFLILAGMGDDYPDDLFEEDELVFSLDEMERYFSEALTPESLQENTRSVAIYYAGYSASDVDISYSEITFKYEQSEEGGGNASGGHREEHHEELNFTDCPEEPGELSDRIEEKFERLFKDKVPKRLLGY